MLIFYKITYKQWLVFSVPCCSFEKSSRTVKDTPEGFLTTPERAIIDLLLSISSKCKGVGQLRALNMPGFRLFYTHTHTQYMSTNELWWYADEFWVVPLILNALHWVEQQVATAQFQAPQLSPKLGFQSIELCMFSPCLCKFHPRSLVSSQLPKSCRWIDYSNLPLGMKVCLVLFLCEYESCVSHPVFPGHGSTTTLSRADRMYGWNQWDSDGQKDFFTVVIYLFSKMSLYNFQ